MTLIHYSFILLVLTGSTLIYAQTPSVDCTSIRGNCEECLQTDECAYCASPVATGCFGSGLSAFCGILGGVLDECDAPGTSCVNYHSCNSCQQNPPCVWCSTVESGYCFDSTQTTTPTAQDLCAALSGTFNSSTCETPSTSTTGGSNPPNGGSVARVDPQGRCESFEGSRCVGVVFFDVFANATYNQAQMSEGAAVIYAYSSLPGVTPSCRTAGERLNCASFFQKCETLPGTSIAVSVPPCRSLCEDFNNECASFLAASGLSLDCNLVDPVTGGWRYPTDKITYSHNGNLYDIQCNDMTASANNAGFYPNRLRNSNFQDSIGDVFEHWINLNDNIPYLLTTDTVFGQDVNVLKVTNTTDGISGAYQSFNMSRTTILPVRISGYTRSINISDTIEPNHFSFWVDLVYEDETTARVHAPIEPSDDYTLITYEFTPVKPIKSVTFACMVNHTEGDAHFAYAAFQERLPPVVQTFECFRPFDFDPDWETKGTDPCAFACPGRIWSNQSLFDSIVTVQAVLSWLSLICTTMIIVTWLVFPKRRKYPDRLALYFAISAWLVALQGALATFYSRESIICKDRFTFQTQHTSSLCAFSGWLLQFGASACIGWWTCISVSTWAMIKYPMNSSKHPRMEKYFHMIVWTYALVSSIIPLAAGKIGNGIASSGMCWISTADDSWWQFATFYIPLGFCLLLASILMSHAMYTIYQIAHYAKRKQDLQTYFRFIGFIMLVGVSVAFLFGYKFYTFANEDKWLAEFAEELICQAEGGSIEECRKARIDSSGVFLNALIISLEGVFISLFFGLQKRNIQLWRDWFRESKLRSFLTTKTVTNGSATLSRTNSYLERSNHSASEKSVELEVTSSSIKE